MTNPISKIDQKILQLRQRKEKLQTQYAVGFMKEAQNILGEKFSPGLALSILSHSWLSSSDHKKKEWEKSCPQGGEVQSKSFRKSAPKQLQDDSKTATKDT
jgi:hypothetical protein